MYLTTRVENGRVTKNELHHWENVSFVITSLKELFQIKEKKSLKMMRPVPRKKNKNPRWRRALVTQTKPKWKKCSTSRALQGELLGFHFCHYKNTYCSVERKCEVALPLSSATDSATASSGGGSMALFKNSPISPSLRSLMVRASSWRGVRSISGVACSASL